MRRPLTVVVLLMVFAMLGVVVWVSNQLPTIRKPIPLIPSPIVPTRSHPPLVEPISPTASEALLEGYGDPSTPPIEDLRKIHRVATGYFTLVKEATRFPFGGNEDFSAALRGENPNREVFVRAGAPVFSKDQLLTDRWGSPLIVHPEAWRQLELRSAGPDKIPYNSDDLVLSPAGISVPVK